MTISQSSRLQTQTSGSFRVTGAGFELADTTKHLSWMETFANPPLPATLGEADSVSCYKPARDIAQTLSEAGYDKPISVRPYVTDSYGNRHVGEWTEINLAELIK